MSNHESLRSECKAKVIEQKRFESIVDSFKSIKPILVFGDVGIDKYTYGEVSRISPEAPVPVLEVNKEWFKLGMAANISHNLETLGVSSTLCGIIGSDMRSPIFYKLLSEISLSKEGIVESSERPTVFKERITTKTQQICRVDYEKIINLTASEESSLKTILPKFAESHNQIIIEDYSKGLLSERILKYSIDLFKESRKLIAVDPGRKTPAIFYKGSTLLKPNLSEAKLIAESFGYRDVSKNSLQTIAEILVEKLSLEKLVITLGPDGMGILDTKDKKTNGKLTIVPTITTEVFDVSGAGDTAIAAIVASLAANATLEESAWIANIASGVVVGKHGTATVNKEELFDFYERFKKKCIM